jgi:hypothetical protein
VVGWSAEDGSSCGRLGFGAFVIATGVGGTAGSWLGLESSGDAAEGVCTGEPLSISAAAVDNGTVGDSSALTALFDRAIAFACNSRTQHGAAVAVD